MLESNFRVLSYFEQTITHNLEQNFPLDIKKKNLLDCVDFIEKETYVSLMILYVIVNKNQ